MRALVDRSWVGCVVLGWLALSGCSSDAKSAPEGSGGTGGALAAGAGTGGSAVAAQGGSGGASGGASGAQGGADSSACSELTLTEGQTGPHGLLALAVPAGFGEFVSTIGLAGSDVYYVLDGNLMHVPAAGGTPVLQAPFVGVQTSLVGNTLVWFEATDSTNTTLRMLTAPITDISQPKVLVASMPAPDQVAVDADTVFYDSRSPSNIWSVPLAGGKAPAILVPGSSPLGMISNGTALYWLDYDSSRLESVPKTGGAPSSLADVFFGGAMAEDANAIYWADTSLNTINRWALGSPMATVLRTIPGFFDSPNSMSVSGSTAYWGQGFICGSVWQVRTDGSGAQMVVQGFDSPVVFAVDATHLYVAAMAGIYRVDR
jgi:hypothetical protein